MLAVQLAATVVQSLLRAVLARLEMLKAGLATSRAVPGKGARRVVRQALSAGPVELPEREVRRLSRVALVAQPAVRVARLQSRVALGRLVTLPVVSRA